MTLIPTPLNASAKTVDAYRAAVKALAVVKARAAVSVTAAELDLRRAELAIAKEQEAD